MRSRPRALLWLLQIDVSTSTTVDRSNIPTAESRRGRLPLFRSSCLGRGRITEWAPGQGPRTTRSSTLPATIARHEDFAPTSTRFGRLVSRPSLSRPVRSDVGRDGYRHHNTRLQGARAIGRWDAALPRRSPTFTNPRRLPSQGRSRTNEGRPPASKLAGKSCRRLFHRRGARTGDARADS